MSIPDRRRIDSDVRAFLREPSTPWIVFDQEGRPPSQLAVGEVLSVPRKMLLSPPSYFTATAAIDAIDADPAPQSKVEPSSLAVASDLTDADVHAPAAPLDGASPIPTRRLSRRVLGASFGALALVATLGIGALAFPKGHDSSASSQAAAANAPARSLGAVVPAENPPPDLDVRPPAPAARPAAQATPAIAVNAAAPARGVPSGDSPAQVAARRFGRLSVVGDARAKAVFLDGKRLLGRGARNFTVTCGKHTIAIGVRSDAHEVELPCTGGAELLVGK